MALATDQYTTSSAKLPPVSVVYASMVFDWIDRKFGDRRNASKKLASFASFGEHQVSSRTSEAWLKRKKPPSLDSIEIMAARCHELAAELERERSRLRELLSR